MPDLLYDGQRSPYVFHHVSTRRAYRAGHRIKAFKHSLAKATVLPSFPKGSDRTIYDIAG